MDTDSSEYAPLETGGMLLGYRSPAGDEVITGVILGGPHAKRTHDRFVGDGEWQQTRLEEIYLASNCVTTYLGEWHSHPSGLLAPSRLDRRTARRIARERTARSPRPLMVIGISEGDGWRWRAFRYGGWHRRLQPVGLMAF